MSELTGSLIQMNAHTHMVNYAQGLVFIGFLVCALTVVDFVTELYTGTRFTAKRLIVLITIFALGFGMIFFGYRVPRQKIIKACANGPISIEQVATRYDILDVDGKMLTLRER